MTRQNDLEDLVPRDVALFMVPKDESGAEVSFVGYEAHIEVADGESSNILYVKDDVSELGLQLSPEGTAYIEYTLSSMSDTASGDADWVKWGPGDVTTNTTEFLTKSITAVRVVSDTGKVKASIQTEV